MRLIGTTIVVSILGIIINTGCTKNKFNSRGRSSNNSEKAVPKGTPGNTDPANDTVSLVWKRYRAFEQTLATGLQLNKDQICNEIGTESCIEKVHLSKLGGNEPYDSAQYLRPEGPAALSGIAIDRVILSACIQRVNLDKNGAPVVFKGLNLNGPMDQSKADNITIELYRRLLARDPSDEEKKILREYSTTVSSAEVFAKTACFAVGSSVEFIFI